MLRNTWPALRPAVIALALQCLAACAPQGDEEAVTQPEPSQAGISSYTVPLPSSIKTARAPAFVAADGSDLLFSFTGDGAEAQELGYIRRDGTGFRCLTCDSDLAGNEPQPLRDGRRVFLQQSENQSAGQQEYVIVECRPSLADCQEQDRKPVTGLGDPSSLQDRVPKISPDEQWVLTTRIRIDGFYMLLGRLVQQADRYEVQDLRVVNPPADPAAGEIDAIAVDSAIYEAKALGSDGRTMTFAATLGDSLNFDWFSLDLPTGRRTRLTRDPDWDEGSQPSPDMRYFRGGSARGRNATAALGNLPRPSVVDFAIMGPVFNYYLPRSLPLPIPGRDRTELLRPFLLPADQAGGDEQGFQISEADEADGWISNGGSGGWSGDGRHILNAQKREGSGETRLRIYTLDGQAPYQQAPQPLQAPSWAPSISDRPLKPRNRIVRVSGPAGGSALITQIGTQAAGVFSVTYTNYSVDGCSRLNGFQTATMTGVLTGNLLEDLTLSGCHEGHSQINTAFADLLTTGQADSRYDDREYSIRFVP